MGATSICGIFGWPYLVGTIKYGRVTERKKRNNPARADENRGLEGDKLQIERGLKKMSEDVRRGYAM
jgi:hypothetical protein